MLKRSPVMLPIPGTGKVKHLEENVAAAGISLSDEEFLALDKAGRKVKPGRSYAPLAMSDAVRRLPVSDNSATQS